MTQPNILVKPKVQRPKTYRTGFCALGQCEGLNPTNYRGQSLPTCKCTSAECACKCHKMYDEMYQIKIEMGKASADEPREIINNSRYVSAPSPYVLPDAYSLMAAREERRAAHKRPDDPDAVVIGRHVFAPTPTGMRAPKQLEFQVLDVLLKWVDPTFEFVPPDPKLIAFKIGEKEGSEPSTGAIHAIFVRWVAIDFGKFQNRPARFLGFVGEGTPEELDQKKKQNQRLPAHKRYQKTGESK